MSEEYKNPQTENIIFVIYYLQWRSWTRAIRESERRKNGVVLCSRGLYWHTCRDVLSSIFFIINGISLRLQSLLWCEGVPFYR